MNLDFEALALMLALDLKSQKILLTMKEAAVALREEQQA